MEHTTNLIDLNLSESEIAKYVSKIIKRQPDECWQWKHKPEKSGYGRYSIYRGRHLPIIKIQAHRIAFFLYWRIDPDGFSVCHECDNRICCNPAHLFVGTNDDNVKDRVQKGRQAHGNTIKPVGRTRLQACQVLEIRRRANEKRSALAKEFGIQSQHVKKIINRELWHHLEEPLQDDKI